ncbi:MAG: hypothetical protein ACSHYB_09665 [Roseibacillus sp.]
MTELEGRKPKAGTRKYNVCLAVCVVFGIAAAARELFGESLALSVMALFYGAVVGAVTYVFSLCVMVLLGGTLRGQFGKQVSNGLCWILLVATPPLAWLVASVTSARF